MAYGDDDSVDSGAILNYAEFDPTLIGSNMVLSGNGLILTKDSAGWQSGYTTARPTSGKYSCVFTVPAIFPTRLQLFGIVRTPTINININSISDCSTYTPNTGDWYLNASIEEVNFWGTFTAAREYVVLIDADNDFIAFEDAAGNLNMTTLAPTGTGTIYIGVSLYDAIDPGTSFVIGNFGQSTYSAAVEAKIATYELLSGDTFNRFLLAA